jgi:putative membrane protein insertion efficiency factor
MNPFSRALVVVLLLPLRLYRRAISPLLGQHCRFHPTCSAYAVDALRTHGPLRGSWLAVRRLGRCQPWNPGGLDPVPPNLSLGTTRSRSRAGAHS